MMREIPGFRAWKTPIYKRLLKGNKRGGGFYDWGQSQGAGGTDGTRETMIMGDFQVKNK